MIDGNLAMANSLEIERPYWVIRKFDPMELFFKCNDKTGRTWTTSIEDAMIFDEELKAIEFNHKEMYGECDVIII